MAKLEGQVAFVTGAGRGVGRTIAEALARNGAAVGLCARTQTQLDEVAESIGSDGGRALSVVADVTDPVAVQEAVAQIEAQLGPISLLVNNAGTLHSLGPLWETDPEVWWRDVETHVRGALICTHAVLQHMIERKRGRVVNVLGMLGQFGEPYVSAYAAAKAALFRLTENLASEVQDFGVTVFSISPGPVRTEMTKQFLDEPDARKWVADFSQMQPDEWMSGEEGANLIVRLAHGEADALSGRFIHVSEDLDGLVDSAAEIRKKDHLVMRIQLRDPDEDA